MLLKNIYLAPQELKLLHHLTDLADNSSTKPIALTLISNQKWFDEFYLHQLLKYGLVEPRHVDDDSPDWYYRAENAVAVTAEGLHYDEYHLVRIKSFLLHSIFTPILVSIVTTLITTLITLMIHFYYG